MLQEKDFICKDKIHRWLIEWMKADCKKTRIKGSKDKLDKEEKDKQDPEDVGHQTLITGNPWTALEQTGKLICLPADGVGLQLVNYFLLCTSGPLVLFCTWHLPVKSVVTAQQFDNLAGFIVFFFLCIDP